MNLRTDDHRVPIASVPADIAQVDGWPWWRRILGRPPRLAGERIAAWRELGLTDAADTSRGAPLLNERPAGIWNGSRVPMQVLVSAASPQDRIDGRRCTRRGIERVTVLNPNGPLVISRSVPAFECDLQDVEGIGGGKSDELFFATVQAFGKYFADYLGASATPEALRAILAHNEVRILRANGGDGFALDLWDDRLFLSNHGGSHHFAGAAYIARQLGIRVALRGPCTVTRLAEPGWRWLLGRYRLLGAPFDLGRHMPWQMGQVARIVGECLQLSKNSHGALFLVPRHHRATATVVDALAAHGCIDQTNVIENLLERQRVRLASVEARWPVLAAAVRDGEVQAPAQREPGAVRQPRAEDSPSLL